MCRQIVSMGTATWLLMVVSATVMAADEDRVLFEFGTPDAANEWQTVNDGVMGGASEGRFKISAEKTLDFLGTLSLENNGGFASVRSKPTKLNLEAGDTLVARVRGDGREYSMNLYTARRQAAFSYRALFNTKKDEWIVVSIPLDKFQATSFGRVVRDQSLDPGEVNGLGILLGDKKAGPFKLEVEWIKVRRPSR
jgi:NADH dehydrogenase [ubiquinone] 1 alpha subcomplex assembly factor 1